MLKIETAVSDGQGSVNEDAVGHHGNAAWVIDGATGIGASLLDAPSDASWLAQTASRLLGEVLTLSPELPTVEVLRTVMTRCAEALKREQVRPAAEPHEHPSAAFAMVRIIEGEAEFTTLADCRVAALGGAGEARLFGVSTLDAIEARTLAAAKTILDAAPVVTPDALKAQLMPVLRANRSLMNREGGYWVLGTEPAAADHVWQTRIPLRAQQRFAIASDGFLRLIELFDAATPADMLAISGAEDAARWIERLRDFERQPDSLRRFTRVKPHDDASLVVCIWKDT
ncbi:hypothetical protein V474_15465 [Novosphingobium barchaimii LL02]|uniref:PPM-type phosphatase domain-containing protein n=1 Tax=Novosphingobium barchaimii LL02 TaxID=1114963 RepID=A0A0J7XZP3_9SPHN|nr:protein phosphatase 2C domain-containing protein [Novosphingobium barchaimii]KMS56658.1 hypothetical protein V474_15465 [Novosphingobium barchaimii LL02]